MLGGKQVDTWVRQVEIRISPLLCDYAIWRTCLGDADKETWRYLVPPIDPLSPLVTDSDRPPRPPEPTHFRQPGRVPKKLLCACLLFPVSPLKSPSSLRWNMQGTVTGQKRPPNGSPYAGNWEERRASVTPSPHHVHTHHAHSCARGLRTWVRRLDTLKSRQSSSHHFSLCLDTCIERAPAKPLTYPLSSNPWATAGGRQCQPKSRLQTGRLWRGCSMSSAGTGGWTQFPPKP